MRKITKEEVVIFLLVCLDSNYKDYAWQIKNVSNEHGVSFHASPAPSLSHISRQCSFSPLSYSKLFGSPAFQWVYFIGFPVAIQMNLPSSPKSLPLVQKCPM